jgi:hypothetical protein
MNKLGYLGHIVKNIERRPLPLGTINTGQFQEFFHGKFSAAGEIVGIRQEARASMLKLTEELFEEFKEIRRGAQFNDLQQTVMNVIFDNFVNRDADAITQADVEYIYDKILTWFNASSPPHTIFIPCVITTFPAASFLIGQIRFDFITQFMANEQSGAVSFKDLPNDMGRAGASWVATVEVTGCVQGRALEFADLAVDLALVGLQLVFPINFSERLARMNAKNLPPLKSTYFRVNGNMQGSHLNQHPTLGLGPGWMEKIVSDGAAVLESVGRRVGAYITGNKKLPNLEQAWCDAAYWYHEGLAEPLETIAVTKLETSIEILFHSKSTSKTK